MTHGDLEIKNNVVPICFDDRPPHVLPQYSKPSLGDLSSNDRLRFGELLGVWTGPDLDG